MRLRITTKTVSFGRLTPAIVLAGLWLTVLSSPSRALSPDPITPFSIIRSCDGSVLLKVSSNDGKQLAVELVETLKGQPPESLKLAVDQEGELSAKDLVSALGPRKSATAVLAFGKAEPLAGVILIGMHWFSATLREGVWYLDSDKRNLVSVWPGNAAMFARAARYVQSNPEAEFPFHCELDSGREIFLGKVPGKVGSCLSIDLGPPVGRCAIILSEGGDHVYQATKEGGAADLTGKLKLTTASRTMAVGDFDGDGRLDLVSWNGEALRLAIQAADGTFTVRPLQAALRDCLSLEAIDAGAKTGAGIVAGTSAGPALLVPNGRGDFAVRPLVDRSREPSAPSQAVGGICVVADFDGDGRCDVVELLADGIAFYAGTGVMQFGPPVHCAVRLAARPRTAVCGDYDNSGRLGLLVGGQGGIALLLRDADGTWSELEGAGELSYYHEKRPNVVALSAADINNDGRQGVAIFHRDRTPRVLFNNGFALFHDAHGLLREPDNLYPWAQMGNALKDLAAGQAGGIAMDLNGDGLEDLVAVSVTGEAWAILSKVRKGVELSRFSLSVGSDCRGPLAVAVSGDNRLFGRYLVKPGIPVAVGCRKSRLIKLEWTSPDGKRMTKEVASPKVVRLEGGSIALGSSSLPPPDGERSALFALLRIEAVAPQAVEAGGTLTVPLSLEHADLWKGKVTFHLGDTAPAWASIGQSSGILTLAPPPAEPPGLSELSVWARGPHGKAAQTVLAVAVTRKPITVDLGSGVKLEMMFIPPGEFMMGPSDSDSYVRSWQKPRHRVRITRPFYLGKFEITQEQWQAVMGNNPSRFKGPKNPVEMVSWNECQQFIEKLNNSVRDRPGEFRLPTEAEWEYACRAGSTTCWCFGGEESRLGEYAWYRSNSGYTTHPVGGKKPNAWGLHDMHGNVWEWCADWKSDYTAKEVTDPTGPSEGAYRVLRGGGRSDFAGGCVSANRNGHAPVLTDDYVGLRVSLVPAGKQ